MDNQNNLYQLFIAFKPILIFIVCIFLFYVGITFLIDRKKDYNRKGHKSVKYHDKDDYCDYIVVPYRLWEKRKIEYLTNYYRNGSQILFNSGDYIVVNMYPSTKVRRKKFFLFGKQTNCWFKRNVKAYVKLTY